jgi:hypothetical protein
MDAYFSLVFIVVPAPLWSPILLEEFVHSILFNRVQDHVISCLLWVTHTTILVFVEACRRNFVLQLYNSNIIYHLRACASSMLLVC